MKGYSVSVRRISISFLVLVLIAACIIVPESQSVYASDEMVVDEFVKMPGVNEKEERLKAEAALEKRENIITADDLEDDQNPVSEISGGSDESAVVKKKTPEPLNAADQAVPENYEAEETVQAKLSAMDGNKNISLQEGEELKPDDCKMTVSVDGNGIASITAYVRGTGWSFSRILVDDYDITGDGIEGSQDIYATYDLRNNLEVGYHTFVLTMQYNESEVMQMTCSYVRRNIYGEKPSISASNFSTGKNYFEFYNSGNSYSEDSGCSVYFDYKKGNGKWQSGNIPVDQYYTKKKSGLSAGSTYYVRAYYGKKVYYDYDGKTYMFVGGNSNIVKIKTAYKKPAVKSIKISKVKTICKKYKYYTGYIRQRWLVNRRTGRRIKLLSSKRLYKTRKYYYTRYKVTVKMKKKQDIAGIQIKTSHGYDTWKGGKKKKYTKTYKVSGKKKGKKLKVSVKSCRSKTYGGWSGTYKKKVKIK